MSAGISLRVAKNSGRVALGVQQRGGYSRLAASLRANSEDWVASLERRLAEQELSKEDTGLEQDAELAVVSASRLRR